MITGFGEESNRVTLKKFSSKPPTSNVMQSYYASCTSTPSASPATPAQTSSVNNVPAGLTVILLPFVLAISVSWYKRHRDYRRALTLLQQIATLENLWRISPKS